jgi:hypothetical protein
MVRLRKHKKETFASRTYNKFNSSASVQSCFGAKYMTQNKIKRPASYSCPLGQLIENRNYLHLQRKKNTDKKHARCANLKEIQIKRDSVCKFKFGFNSYSHNFHILKNIIYTNYIFQKDVLDNMETVVVDCSIVLL